MQIFVLVDVLLVALLVVLVATLPRGASAEAGPTTAAPAGTPTATPGAGRPVEEDPVAFSLPSGNIACEMTTQGVLCTIANFSYAPPPVPGCDAPTGHVLTLDAQGVAFLCEEGEVPRVQGAPELAYGKRQTVGEYTCGSGTDGVTCTDPKGVGFRLARGQWAELP